MFLLVSQTRISNRLTIGLRTKNNGAEVRAWLMVILVVPEPVAFLALTLVLMEVLVPLPAVTVEGSGTTSMTNKTLTQCEGSINLYPC